MSYIKRPFPSVLKIFTWSVLPPLLIVIAWSLCGYFVRQYCETVAIQLGGEKTIACQGKWIHSFAMEAPLSELAFIKYTKEQRWKVHPIQRPFKMVRYTLAKPESDSRHVFYQVMDGSFENETCNSYYHFIKKGYYYLDESSGYTIHVAYDADLQKYYYYRKIHGPGYRQAEINPYWTKKE